MAAGPLVLKSGIERDYLGSVEWGERNTALLNISNWPKPWGSSIGIDEAASADSPEKTSPSPAPTPPFESSSLIYPRKGFTMTLSRI